MFSNIAIYFAHIIKQVGSMVKLPEDEDTPEKRVKKIFRMMDKDENGSLDMEEFKVRHHQSSSPPRIRVKADNFPGGQQARRGRGAPLGKSG